MSIEMTDRDIQDKDTAYRLSFGGPKMPFAFRVDADMKGGFTVSLNNLTRNDAGNLLMFLKDHHEEWLQMSSRRDWSENMTHQFAIGDTVELNGTKQRGKVVGFSPEDRSLLACDWVGYGPGSSCVTYVPVHSVTLVRSGGAAQANHPSKIETTVEARDVTTTWDGGHKIHEPHEIET